MTGSAHFLPYPLHRDIRGAHSKFFSKEQQEALANFSIKEVFMTTNAVNSVRGFAVQLPAQAKLVQVIHGEILAHAVCCNSNSENFGKIIRFRMKSYDGESWLVPGDWALAYRALAKDTKVLYLANEDFNGGQTYAFDPFDAELGIDWEIEREEAVQTDRDRSLPSFAEFGKIIRDQQRKEI